MALTFDKFIISLGPMNIQVVNYRNGTISYFKMNKELKRI